MASYQVLDLGLIGFLSKPLLAVLRCSTFLAFLPRIFSSTHYTYAYPQNFLIGSFRVCVQHLILCLGRFFCCPSPLYSQIFPLAEPDEGLP